MTCSRRPWASPPARVRAITARWRGGRVRRDRRARPRPRLVLADPGRDGRVRPSLARPRRRRCRAWPTCGPSSPPGCGCRQPRLARRPARGGGRERRIRAALPPPRIGTAGHVADAEVHWPSSPPGPHAGQVWAVEVELTPKPAARTARIMAGLLARPRYAQVVYLAAPAARPVVTGTAAALPDAQRGRVAVRDLPAAAFLPRAGTPHETAARPRADLAAAPGAPPGPPPARRRHPGGAVAGDRRRGRWPPPRRGWPGWPPARLYRAAAWSGPVAVVWLIAAAMHDRAWQAVALAPVDHVAAGVRAG